MATLLDLVLAEPNLIAAWRRVWDNDGGPGVDGVTLAEFGKNALEGLQTLRAELRTGRYRPAALRELELPRSGRAPRLLAVPTVRDRVLQTAVALVLSPVLDKRFADESFAYRPGRSVAQAVEQVVGLREAGLLWVVDADIEDYFDSIDHALLLQRLEESLPDISLHELVAAWLRAPGLAGEVPHPRSAGVPQGSPLSPLLSNLYLDAFDLAIRDPSRGYVRYADDFLLLCADYESAERALEEVGERLAAEELALNFAKTRITSFAAGFEFLGVRFHGNEVRAEDPEAARWVLPRSLQPAPGIPTELAPLPEIEIPPRAHRPAGRPSKSAHRGPDSDAPAGASRPPLLRTLHLAEPGAYLHRRGGCVVVRREERELLELPLEKLDQVCATQEGAVSFSLLREFMERKVSFVLSGNAGEPIGWMEDFAGGRVMLHREQFRRLDDARFCLAAATVMVSGKIANSRVVLRRYGRTRPERDSEADVALADLGYRAQKAASLEQLRGYEGAAARRYFAALGRLIPSDWGFTGRNRQPPRDPINVLLSYGYAVLFQNVLTLLVRRGLNPHLGALHAIGERHAALASDLMEEFRPLVVDAVVLRLVLNGGVKLDDFETGRGAMACRMGDRARRAFIHALEEKFDQPLQHPHDGRELDLRRAIAAQVHRWGETVAGQAQGYRAFVLR